MWRDEAYLLDMLLSARMAGYGLKERLKSRRLLQMQSKELKKSGVPVIHYYTIGISDNIRQIVEAVF